ncbi:efflux RND transporter periplasmic adaptor subunit [Spirosoma sordidisoli]|uniref:Efflux RND transporter periplasmic adaptor subunit n=1 Tax=Spirosoma sordidisoli TaxID=2502893 RepID=A0A4Q2UKX2_9BACT|nr:efflux RND transporter periplasmic adaptor subunit [Spirosoma sordidisoli]RYC68125.1 efflux RND transporter periplasmic adaptor subunit [Spirosoma sordidisoli]
MSAQLATRSVRVQLSAPVLFVLLVVALLPGCSSETKQQAAQTETYPVIQPVITDTIYAKEYVADIQAVQNVEIRTRIEGYLDRIYVDEGTFVQKGQLLFTVSNPEYREELLKAQASLKNAMAEAKTADVEVKSVSLLAGKQIISGIELEKAQAKLAASQAKIDEARTSETAARLKLALTQIRAPFAGTIDRIPNKVGSLVGEGTLLTTLSDNRQVFAYFNVPEGEYLDFMTAHNPLQKRAVSLLLANNRLHGSPGAIEKVDGQIDRSTGNIAFRARFANPRNLLKHGSSGKVRMNQTVTNALLIPQQAAFELQDKLFVFVVGADNRVQMRSFVPRLRLPQLYVVGSGLSASDRILYEGIQTVKEGDIIQPKLLSAPQVMAQLARQ